MGAVLFYIFLYKTACQTGGKGADKAVMKNGAKKIPHMKPPSKTVSPHFRLRRLPRCGRLRLTVPSPAKAFRRKTPAPPGQRGTHGGKRPSPIPSFLLFCRLRRLPTFSGHRRVSCPIIGKRQLRGLSLVRSFVVCPAIIKRRFFRRAFSGPALSLHALTGAANPPLLKKPAVFKGLAPGRGETAGIWPALFFENSAFFISGGIVSSAFSILFVNICQILTYNASTSIIEIHSTPCNNV